MTSSIDVLGRFPVTKGLSRQPIPIPPGDEWKGEHLIPAISPERIQTKAEQAPKPKPKPRRRNTWRKVRPPAIVGTTCAVRGCRNKLRADNKSGVCREHNHDRKYCQCRRCHPDEWVKQADE